MEASAPQQMPLTRPLVVDLDGTLLKSDSLLEAMCAVVRRRFLDGLYMPFWILKGRAYFKEQVFARMDADIARLPFHQELLDALCQQHRQGRRLVLATGAHQNFADKVAEHLGIFTDAFGSSRRINLIGAAKAAKLVEAFGAQGFDYAGNSRDDLAVWKHAASAWVMSDSRAFTQEVKAVLPVEREFNNGPPSFKIYAKALRLHQWAKNGLIFLPMVLSHRYFDGFNWVVCLLAFASFSCVASSVYLLNDLLDIESDRRHPDNRNRPFAAGTLSILAGWSWAPLLLLGGLGIGLYISQIYFLLILGYFAMTCLYSLRLKQVVLADVVVLGLLYTWRVLAGGVATETIISQWFLTFAMFFFLSLALLKRCSELILMEQNHKQQNKRRGYFITDLPILLSFGIASGYLSVLVLALYLNDGRVAEQLHNPEALWILCPLLIYWLSRLWLKAYRGKMTTDPLVFALKDRTSYILVILTGCLWLVARGLPFLTFAF